MKNLVIFASGSGSNAENIIRYFAQKPEFCIKKIYCNVPDAYVLERAKKYGVPAQVFNREEFRNPEKILHQAKRIFIINCNTCLCISGNNSQGMQCLSFKHRAIYGKNAISVLFWQRFTIKFV